MEGRRGNKHVPASHKLRAFLGCVLAGVLGLFIPAGPVLAQVVPQPQVAAPQSAGRQVLRGHVPSITARLQPLGRLPATANLRLAIALPLRNRESLTTLLQQLYDPASPQYHRYLTPDQFAAQFGPTEADYEALIDFAKSNGLTVTGTHPNRALLDVGGTVADIERAFHVTLRVYPHPSEARTFFAPEAEPAIDLALPILAVSGLDNYAVPQPGSRAEPLANGGGASPGAGSGFSGPFMGNDFRAAYVPGVSLDGTGQAVGLLELDGYYPNDITTYEDNAELPHVPLLPVLLDGFSGTPTANATNVSEVSLDIEVVVAMAPGLSKVIVYEAPDDGPGYLDILSRMATDNAAKQLSSSWIIPDNPTADQSYLQFAAQRQSFFQASGDYDAYYPGIPEWADNTNITIVGGTTLSTTGPGGAYVSETVWNNGDGTRGSGGGISVNYAIPSWQQGVNMSANGGSSTMRNIPDVAMVAENVSVIANDGQQQQVVGTSIAAPLWAGFTALVNQQRATNATSPIGFLNPAIYAIGKSANYTSCFHDITSGNNTSFGSPNQFYAVPRYDLCTGWGTPTGSNLINALSGVSVLGPPTIADVCVGNPILLLGSGSGYDYQWWKDGIPLMDGDRIIGSQTNSLTVLDASLTDTGTYVLTNLLLVKVTNGPLTNISSTVTNQGATADCFQTNYTFITISNILEPGLTITSTNVIETNTAPAAGCAETNFVNIVVTTTTTVTTVGTNSTWDVSVVGPPTITNFYMLTTGDGVAFTVEASDAVSYQWYWQGRPIPGENGYRLVYQNAYLDASAGYYSVVVFGRCGITSSPPPGLLFTKTWPAGTYQGLFFNTNAATLETSGFFQYNLTGAKGAFSGKILLNNKSYPFSGVFLRDQSSQVKVPGTSLTLALQLVATNDTGQVIGTVTNQASASSLASKGWASPLYGHLLFYNSINPFPQAGKFTLSMMNTNFLPANPNGACFAAITVSTNGSVALSGRVADDTAIAENCGLSKTGDLPLYVPLLKGRGGIFGWLQITDSGIEGDPIFWIKEAGPDKRYPKGFKSTLQAQGSTYTGPPASQILAFTNGVMAFTAGDFFSSDGTNIWDFARVAVTPPGLSWQPIKYDYRSGGLEKVGIDINPGNGIFTGHFIDEKTGLSTPLRGIVLQQQGFGQGYFLSPSASGYLWLGPVQ